MLLAAALALELTARRRPDHAPLGHALAAAMRRAPGRVAVLVAWVWLGVHFLAR